MIHFCFLIFSNITISLGGLQLAIIFVIKSSFFQISDNSFDKQREKKIKKMNHNSQKAKKYTQFTMI